MLWLNAIMLPVVGALIGWLTNWLAVKMLFRPYRPFVIPGTGLVIQGLLPRRRRDLARTVGEVVERELFSVDDLLVHVRAGNVADRMSAAAQAAVYQAVIDRSPAILPLSVKKFFAELISEMIADEVPAVAEQVLTEVARAARGGISIARMVEERLNAFPLEELEGIVLRVASRELKHITVLGGVLGFVIGILQVGFLYLTRLTGGSGF
ncbi:MAG: DUF445 family protein [Thermoanaerobacterales bacterium]|nr:DUF445 family protein [Bacillota bacterium]MDI6907520.1 DUF445 family protein [Thermoanaerobacterales bacterium]